MVIIIILILGFVRAAGGQGLNLAVIIHESRALTEGKQIRETFINHLLKILKKYLNKLHWTSSLATDVVLGTDFQMNYQSSCWIIFPLSFAKRVYKSFC